MKPQRQRIESEKISVFDQQGSLLWRSPAWGALGRIHFSELSDEQWQEFIHPDDVAPLLSWFGDGIDSPTQFRMFHPVHEKWFVCFFHKVVFGPVVICVGDERLGE